MTSVEVDAPTSGGVMGIDTGGTFTDVVFIDSKGVVWSDKALTTPGDLSKGVLAALSSLADKKRITLPGLLETVGRIKHGTTVATNALLTRAGARTALVTTAGFEDTPLIMRAIGRVDGLPPELVRHVTWVTKPVPLVSKGDIWGVRERVDSSGRVLEPLNESEIDRVIQDVVDAGYEAVAVCFLHSWANPTHEEAFGRRARSLGLLNKVYLSLSTRLSREAGEYARMNTALVDAYVGPIVSTYLSTLVDTLQEMGFTGDFFVMKGDGGCARLDSWSPIQSLQSGPAAGVVAALRLAGELGHQNVVTGDMGGTSYDVAVLTDRFLPYAEEPVFERFRLNLPMLAVDSIGAGGGTIAEADSDTRRLIVGPSSAGATPGPACYGNGGEKATVTDANLVMGLLNPRAFLRGRHKLEEESAARVVARIANQLDMSQSEVAAGVHEIVNGKMADLIRARIQGSGFPTSSFALYSYGGAAGLHAAEIAEELGIATVVIFPFAGTFSAYGAALAPIIETRTRSTTIPVGDDWAVEIAKILSEERAASQMVGAESVDLTQYVSVRYVRQTHGVEFEYGVEPDVADTRTRIEAAFAREYEKRYGKGTLSPTSDLELYRVRTDLAIVDDVHVSTTEPAMSSHEVSSQEVISNTGLVMAAVTSWEGLPRGPFGGPRIIELGDSTVWVPSGWEGAIAEGNALVLTHLSHE